MIFTYKAITKEGKAVTGQYDANEKQQVVAYLKAQHMTPVSVLVGTTSELKEKLKFLDRGPKAKDMNMFCEQFCSLLRAGVTIIDALRMLADQTKNKCLQQGINVTITAINEGEPLGRAMSRSPKAFDATLVSLVTAGEASGSLDTSLERMANQYKKDAEIAAAIKKAITYPIIVLVVSVAVVIFMLVYVVPKFMEMFNDIGIEMPKITLAVVAASEWMQKYWYIALLIIIAIVVALVLFKRSPTGKKFFSKMALLIPGINNFVIKSSASKIARTMSTLLSAGMSIVEALQILESTLGNYYYKEAIRDVRKDVLTGRSMYYKMSEEKYHHLFPPMLVHMIAVGEDTGDTTGMLIRTADYYDLEVETATQTMMSMMQPAIIILLAGVVGILLAAVLSPMVSLYSQLGDAL